jgi:hypothetical protein
MPIDEVEAAPMTNVILMCLGLAIVVVLARVATRRKTSTNKYQWVKWLGIAVAGLLGLGLLAVATVAWLIWMPSISSDAAMIEYFRRHRANFDSLVVMTRQDTLITMLDKSRIGRVMGCEYYARIPGGGEFGYNGPRPELGMTAKRLDAYQKLIRPLHVVFIHSTRSVVIFQAGIRGGMVPDAKKDFVWRSTPPELLLASLDELERRPSYLLSPFESYYRHIEGNWYLSFTGPR